MALHKISLTGVYAVEFATAQEMTCPDGNTFPVPANKPYAIPAGSSELMIDPGGKVGCMTKGRFHPGNQLLQGMTINEVRESAPV